MTVPTLLEYYQDHITLEVAQERIVADWNRETGKYTLQEQRDEYRRIHGLGPYEESTNTTSKEQDLMFLVWAAIGVLGAALLAILVYVGRRVYIMLKNQAALA